MTQNFVESVEPLSLRALQLSSRRTCSVVKNAPNKRAPTVSLSVDEGTFERGGSIIDNKKMGTAN